MIVDASQAKTTVQFNDRITAREFIIKYGALIAMFLLILYNVIFTKNFLSVNTLFLTIRQTAGMLFMTVGMTLVIASGGIDISSGSMMAFAGIIMARGLMATSDAFFWLWFLVALAGCALVGMFNGYLISKFNVQPIIHTLVMQMMIRGVVLLVASSSRSTTLFLDPYPTANFLGLYRVGGIIPIQLFYFIILGIGAIFFVKKTTMGKNIEAVGSGMQASRLAGIRINKVIIIVYMLSAVLAGICGILEMSRQMVMDPNELGNLRELDAIAAVAVGGTSMRGGKINMLGSMAGCVIMVLITTTVNMNGIPAAASNLIKAAIIILALSIQREGKA